MQWTAEEGRISFAAGLFVRPGIHVLQISDLRALSALNPLQTSGASQMAEIGSVYYVVDERELERRRDGQKCGPRCLRPL